MRKYNRQSTTILGNLNSENINLIRKSEPTMPTFMTIGEQFKAILFLILGLLPYWSVPFDSYPVFYMTGNMYKMATGMVS